MSYHTESISSMEKPTKLIRNINIDFNDIKLIGETRALTVLGDNGAVFSLEVTNEDSPKKYYNFKTNLFQTSTTGLKNISISGNSYSRSITFPEVTDADRYDFRLFAEILHNTKHVTQAVNRFADGSLNINNSIGSNSNVVEKVIYQTAEVDLDINVEAADGVITGSGLANTEQTITASRGTSVAQIPFSINVSVTSGALTIDRQPVESDIMSYVTRTIDLEPVDIYAEKTTVSVETGTINGARTGAGGHDTVIIDEVAATVAAVGDRITGSDFLNARNVTVLTVSASTGKTFTVSEVITIADGETITFTNQKNYRWGIDNIHGLASGMEIKATTGAQGNGFTGSATIKDYLDEIAVFPNELNEYKIENVSLVSLDNLMVKPTITRNASTNVVTTVQTGNMILSQQAKNAFGAQSVKIFAYGREKINKLTGYDVEFSDLKAVLNTVTATTSAAVNPASTTIPVTTSTLGIVDKTTGETLRPSKASKDVFLVSVNGLSVGQSLYAAGDAGLVGTPKIMAIDETNNKITLSTVQSFTKGLSLIFPNSIISGSGISNTGVNPYVDTISSLNLTASIAQTLENGQTLTFTGAGNIVTITGNVKVNKIGNEAVAIKFDIDKFLTQH